MLLAPGAGRSLLVMRLFRAAARAACARSRSGCACRPRRCLRSRLYSSIQAATRARAWALVAKRSRERSSNSRVLCQLSMTALSRAEPTLPIDCLMPSRPQAARKVLAVYSLPWIGVHDHAGDRIFAAADGDGHRQCRVGQLGVVVLVHREADGPAGTHVQHRAQEQLALVGHDLGAVPVPLAIHRDCWEIAAEARVDCRLTRVRVSIAPLACHVVRRIDCPRILRSVAILTSMTETGLR